MMLDARLLTVPIDYHGCWHITLFLGLAACAVGFIWTQPIDRWAAALWAFFVVRCLWIIEFPGLPYGDYTRAFQAFAGQALAEGFLIPLAAIRLQRASARTWKIVWWAVRAFVAMEIAGVWTVGHGFLTAAGSASMDTAFLAYMAPTLGIVGAILATVTVLTHHGATALLILGCYVAAYCLSRRKISPLWLVFPVLLGLAMVGARHGLLSGSGRVVHWESYFRVWATDWRNWIVGSGAGSFIGVSLLVDAFGDPQFLTMHSDVLQLLFDLGGAGLALGAVVYVRMFRAVWRSGKWQIQGGVLAILAWMMFYHPLRFFPSALVLTIFASRWLYKPTGVPGSET